MLTSLWLVTGAEKRMAKKMRRGAAQPRTSRDPVIVPSGRILTDDQRILPG